MVGEWLVVKEIGRVEGWSVYLSLCGGRVREKGVEGLGLVN